MYRVNIRKDRYRAVLIGAYHSYDTVIEETDWRIFSEKLKKAVEHEAAITKQILSKKSSVKRKGTGSEPEISGIRERRD